ncbi:putative bifunctional diguanylate cyclase/phosphodiesterase [Vibrio cincinnatiensis]|uniref:putative bifunctional diguanylate cyclase/phosphodiesterase n=1 Tax=Vibrio cincinnatiensis TaxID=675 RepID=UPI001EE093A0|nr:EAL domain-containing protein [Vibrio cincinnatiensis]MCG3734012.1 EAL domain-containing protein [Vibrio cincinnatiensis]MCG3741226.1 EAL domain-containing protein [Vibrio cincinnatiensis]MCG3742920.1 EAL domain-containing protein [Vibrio cincinnatiensis]
MSSNPSQKYNSKRKKWELKFATRITLIFGFLGLVALLASMLYSLHTAQNDLQEKIDGHLSQRALSIQNLIENRLELLEVYLHTTASNRIFSSLTEQEAEFDSVANDMIFMLQDSSMGAILDLFFLVDSSGELLVNAGLPLYDIQPLLHHITPPLHYTNQWTFVHSAPLTALIKAVPLFDPATIRLRGYMFIGLAIGQNRNFIKMLTERADVDKLTIHYQGEPLIHYQTLTTSTQSLTLASKESSLPSFHLRSSPLEFNHRPYPITLELGIEKHRFPSITEHYMRPFLLLSGGFLCLLIIAAWVLHLSHNRAISQLTNYIQGIQKGLRVRFASTGIYEYNQVGEAMQRMVENLKIAATVFESAEGMIVTDANKYILRVNQAFTDITGYQTYDVLGQHLDIIRSLQHAEHYYDELKQQLDLYGSWQGEMWNRRKNGEEYLQWTHVTAVMDDNEESVLNYVITLVDVTQRNAAENKIKQLAFYDQLTGLPNRQLLMERLEQARRNSTRDNHYGAVLYLDLDNFKILNDTRGHDIGDKFLTQVSQRLSECIRRTDTVARIGGDEFVMVLEQLGFSEEIASKRVDLLCQKILHAQAQPYTINEMQHYSTLSIGVTLFQGEEQSLDDLLKQADLAMYQSKSSGRNTHRFFNPEMQKKVLEHAAMANDLRYGIPHHQFVLYYQPQVTHSGELVGAEALIRWKHPKHGMISPAQFIPVAEETGLILPLGEWILNQAGKVLATWRHTPLTQNLVLAINISAKQFHQTHFVEQVMSILQKHGANPQQLKLEITESMLHQDLEDTIAKITQLKQHGVHFALDDFGTGYSSLNYLKKLPLDQLKIDQSFVHDLLTNTHDADIARTIVSLAKSMKLSVIAEGVETQEQRDRLASYGCLHFQGYLFGAPVPIEEFPFNYAEVI